MSSFVAGLAVFLFLATFDRSQHRILPLCHVASNSVLIGSEADTRQQGDATLGTENDAAEADIAENAAAIRANIIAVQELVSASGVPTSFKVSTIVLLICQINFL